MDEVKAMSMKNKKADAMANLASAFDQECSYKILDLISAFDLISPCCQGCLTNSQPEKQPKNGVNWVFQKLIAIKIN